MERYIPLTVMRAAQKESQRFFDTAKINHTELKFEDVTIKHTTFVYAAELGNNQSVMNKHFEHLHDLRIGDMDKFSKICVDKSQAFSLAKALDFHKSPADARRKIVKGWHYQAVSSGLVDEGGSGRRKSRVKLSGSQKILKEIKNTVKGDYYKKFIQDLEDLIGDSVETPFQCTW